MVQVMNYSVIGLGLISWSGCCGASVGHSKSFSTVDYTPSPGPNSTVNFVRLGLYSTILEGQSIEGIEDGLPDYLGY